MRRHLLFHATWIALTVSAILLYLRDLATEPVVLETHLVFGGGDAVSLRFLPSILFRQHPVMMTVVTSLFFLTLTLTLRFVRILLEERWTTRVVGSETGGWERQDAPEPFPFERDPVAPPVARTIPPKKPSQAA